MKKLHIAGIYIVLILFFAACETSELPGPDTYGPINEKSYIQGFVDLESVKVGVGPGFFSDKANNKIVLDGLWHPSSTGTGIVILVRVGSPTQSRGLISYETFNPYRNEYFRYVDLINDTSYNSSFMDGLDRHRAHAITDTVQTINIICDKDFDASHKAGDNLNDLFSIYFEDPYATVKNGYKSSKGKNYFEVDIVRKFFPYSFFGDKLVNVDLSKKYFIGTYWYLALEAVPDYTDDYSFTVTITNVRGNVITETADAVKIKGVN